MARCLYQWEGPTKLFSEWGACDQKAPDCRLQIPGTATMAYCLPQGQDGWPQSISSDG
jgi:hypothetical protein